MSRTKLKISRRTEKAGSGYRRGLTDEVKVKSGVMEWWKNARRRRQNIEDRRPEVRGERSEPQRTAGILE